MCATCGCNKPKDKHGMKSVAAANKKFGSKCKTCGKAKCSCSAKKASPKPKKAKGK